MGNQVTVKIDSKFFYGLIALLAVLAIFGIGWFLGEQLGDDSQTAGVVQPGCWRGCRCGPAGRSRRRRSTSSRRSRRPPASNPVSVEVVPVGDSEARIWIPEPSETNWTYHLGEIAPDKATEKDFIIENTGTADLVISDASASCGCTSGPGCDSTLGPGESTTVRVSYDPRVNNEVGQFVQKSIRIKSNDPVAPLVEFAITADVLSQ